MMVAGLVGCGGGSQHKTSTSGGGSGPVNELAQPSTETGAGPTSPAPTLADRAFERRVEAICRPHRRALNDRAVPTTLTERAKQSGATSAALGDVAVRMDKLTAPREGVSAVSFEQLRSLIHQEANVDGRIQANASAQNAEAVANDLSTEFTVHRELVSAALALQTPDC